MTNKMNKIKTILLFIIVLAGLVSTIITGTDGIHNPSNLDLNKISDSNFKNKIDRNTGKLAIVFIQRISKNLGM